MLYKRSYRFTQNFVILLFLLAVLSIFVIVSYAIIDIRSYASYSEGPTNALDFPSQIGVDLSNLRCRFGPNIKDEWGTSNARAFSADFARCKSQFFSDIDFLGSTSVRSVRLLVNVSQFIYDPATDTYTRPNAYTVNLDEYLNRLASHNIKAHVGLANTYSCSKEHGTEFDYRVFNDQQKQSQYLDAITMFIEKYANNTTIASYDLLNEADSILRDQYLQSYINNPTPCMTASKTEIKQFFEKLYTKVRSVDRSHKFTYSLSGLSKQDVPLLMPILNGIVDFYDIHMYVSGYDSQDQTQYYRDFPSLDKPIVHGEIGIEVEKARALRDGNDAVCESYYEDLDYPRQANGHCQEKKLFSVEQWINKAKEHGIDTVFIQNFNHTNSYIFRQYTKEGPQFTISDRILTPAGFAALYSDPFGCNQRPCPTRPPKPTLAPYPTPNMTVPPPRPAAIQTGGIASNAIDLFWKNDAFNATSITLAYTANTTPQQWKTVTLAPSIASYTITNLQPSTEYYVGLRACNNVGCSIYQTTDLIKTASNMYSPSPSLSPSPTFSPTPSSCPRGGCVSPTPTSTPSPSSCPRGGCFSLSPTPTSTPTRR